MTRLVTRRLPSRRIGVQGLRKATHGRSLPPQAHESLRVCRGVPDGVLNLLVAHVILDEPRVVPAVGELVPAGVLQPYRGARISRWVRREPAPRLEPSAMTPGAPACGALAPRVKITSFGKGWMPQTC